MTNISLWHTIDRVLACALMSLEVTKLVVMRPYTRPPVYAACLVGCLLAVLCFLRSQAAQETLDAPGFVFWHSCWHGYPVLMVGVRCLEVYLNRRRGEYYNFDAAVEKEAQECRCKGGEGDDGILLSTIAMTLERCRGATIGRTSGGNGGTTRLKPAKVDSIRLAASSL